MNIRNFCIRTLLVVGLSIVFILSPSVSAARWYKDYDEAKEAAKRGNWTAAIELLKQAIKEEPEPGERKRTYGMHFIEYYPYLKLGQAYLEIGNREAALQACEEAKKKDVAPKEEVDKCLTFAKQTPQVITSPGNIYAVFIGIEDYQDECIPDLRFTVNDVQGIYDVFTDPDYGGIPEDHVKLLLDQDATDLNIKNVLGEWLSGQAEKDDTVIIYYVGHEALEGEDAYWVMYNTDIEDLDKTALNTHDIADMLANVRSTQVIMFLDSCYIPTTESQENRAGDPRTEASWEKFSGEGRVIIRASDGKLCSKVFAYCLLEGLKGKADENRDGVVTVDEIWNYVNVQVTETSTKVGNPQTPLLMGKITTEIPLAFLRKQSIAEKQQQLTELFQQGLIQPEHFDCAYKMLESEKSNPLLDGLLSGKISPEVFNRAFTCESQ